MTKLNILLLLSFVMMLAACSDNSTSANHDDDDDEDPIVLDPVVITLDNVGAQAYQVISIEGEGAAAPLNENNVEITLEAGMRFTFVNDSGASNHPLDFRNGDNQKLFGQSNAQGLLDNDESIELIQEGNSITFTLTDDLADLLRNYVCSFHPGMGGTIRITE